MKNVNLKYKEKKLGFGQQNFSEQQHRNDIYLNSTAKVKRRNYYYFYYFYFSLAVQNLYYLQLYAAVVVVGICRTILNSVLFFIFRILLFFNHEPDLYCKHTQKKTLRVYNFPFKPHTDLLCLMKGLFVKSYCRVE